MTGQLALPIPMLRPRTPAGWFLVTWRVRQEEPLYRERLKGWPLALKRCRQLVRGGIVGLWEGGFLGVEWENVSLYCDSTSARAWG